uniref:Fibronectin type III domain containing 7 n=1 Tax=Takifugu rubripes TaxID=31033 RepID=H2SS69_TAKRU
MHCKIGMNLTDMFKLCVPFLCKPSSYGSILAPAVMDPIQSVKLKNSRTLMVDFNLKSGASQYIIRVQNGNGFFREDRVSSSPAEIQSLVPYTEYTLSIMAVNSGGRSQPSAPVTAKTVLPPIEITSSSFKNDSITLSWGPIATAVIYTLSIYKFGSSTHLKQNTSSTNWTFSGLDAGSLYAITGHAWDLEGREGEKSLYINQTTRKILIFLNKKYQINHISPEFKHDNAELYGSVQYHVISDQNLTCNSTSSSCTLWVADCGQTHSIQVTASNEAGPSQPSNPVFFTTCAYPCPPGSLELVESSERNCTLKWKTVLHADSYEAFIKRGDGGEESCNTTTNNCTYRCECGYTYLMSVFALNQAGTSPEGEVFNYTTLPCCPESVSVSAVSTDTLEITWAASRGAELYETRAVDGSDVILCNDTAPVCALSDLSCDGSYSVLVTFSFKSNTKLLSALFPSAPCMPVNLQLTLKNSSAVSVSWTAQNRAATYAARAMGGGGVHNCTSSGSSCNITDLPCGSTYEISVTANSAAGQSLPSYTDVLETAPCCPANLTVVQVTQAMTNVSWSHARGSSSFIISLTSSRGHARCHTQESHCLMGCITCGTNYTVTMATHSQSGHVSNCTYQGFSSSACCPSGVRLYRMDSNSLRVHWRSSGSSHNYVTELLGSSNNYTCTASPGQNSCDIAGVQCGDVYNVVVAPLTPEGSKVQFCAHRLYSVIFRGKRSVD